MTYTARFYVVSSGPYGQKKTQILMFLLAHRSSQCNSHSLHYQSRNTTSSTGSKRSLCLLVGPERSTSQLELHPLSLSGKIKAAPTPH